MIDVIARRISLLLSIALLVVAVPLSAQDAPSSARMPSYEVVSIKPNNSGNNMTRMEISPDRFSASGITLKNLIQFAYDLKMEDQIAAAPGWADSTRFDIAAKMDEADTADLKKLPPEQSAKQRRLMMQAMLEDRFKLKIHHDTKELPMYALVVAKAGPKLKEADPNDTYANGIKGPDGASHAGMMMIRNGTLTAQAIPLSNLASNLSRQLHRVVVDKTGLAGKYDFTLQWTPDDMASAQPDNTAANSAPSIFTALQEQLGLKLESTKGPLEAIVVDHVEMPSEN